MHIDICVCTHNPRQAVFEKVLRSIFHQQITEEHFFSVLVIDSASSPPISESLFDRYSDLKVKTEIIREPLPGIAKARLSAIPSLSSSWVLFVDDDNELSPDYLLKGIAIINRYPKLGCFGGKLLLPEYLHPPAWVNLLLPYLGIRDHGEERVERLSEKWGIWEPPGAGAFVHRDVLEEFFRKSGSSQNFFRLGRTATNLLSCDDSILMRGASTVGRRNAYEPSLVLWHHLDPLRFRFGYLFRLMYGYGISHVILDSLCRGSGAVPAYYTSILRFFKMIFSILAVQGRKSLPYALCMAAYHWGARREHLAQKTGGAL